MILRLIRLTRVTRWNATKGANLAKATIIYAENGRGKTSLAAVVRSLSSGDPLPILERHTIGTKDAPAAEFLVDVGAGNQPCAFDGTAWNTTLPDIAVFDTTFISENVYSGDDIDPEHRRRLHKFVLGSVGVALAKEVDVLDVRIREINQQISTEEDRLSSRLQGLIALDAFLSSSPSTELPTQIEDQEKRLRLSEQSERIQKAAEFVAVPRVNIGVQEVLATLARSLDALAADAEQVVRNHVAGHLGTEGKVWLEQGMEYLKDGTACPFCGLDATASTLVSAYRQVFSEQYKAYREMLAKHRVTISEALSEAALVRIENIIQRNDELNAFWKGLGAEAPARETVPPVRPRWEAARKALAELLAEKERDILLGTVPTEEQGSILNAFGNLLTQLDTYNATVGAQTLIIQATRQRAEAANVQAETQTLERLRLLLSRGEPEVSEVCRRLLAYRAEKQRLESDKGKAKKALDEEADTLLSVYQKSINTHLQNSGCEYSITGTKTSYAGGKPRTEYQLLLNSKAVDLTQPKGKPYAPCFRNTLSDGDRSTLAFALFLARLDLDPDLHRKILVIDDPMTSLDSNRRGYTSEIVAGFVGRARQVILMTHDAHFAADVWIRLIKPKVSLQLVQNGPNTMIDEWDSLAATQSDYFKRCSLLSNCVAGAPGLDALMVAGALRPVLEANLRVRFPGQFPPEKWLGELIDLTRSSLPGSALAGLKPKLLELVAINDYSKKYHHDDGRPVGTTTPAAAELQAYARRVLAFIQGT